MKCQTVLFAKITHSLSAKANVNFFYNFRTVNENYLFFTESL